MYNRSYQYTNSRAIRIATVPVDWPKNRHLKNKTIFKRYFTPAQGLWLAARETTWDYFVDDFNENLSVYMNVDSIIEKDWTALGVLFPTPIPGELSRIEFFEEIKIWNSVYIVLSKLMHTEYILLKRRMLIDRNLSDSSSLRVEIQYDPSIIQSDLYSSFEKANTSPFKTNCYMYSW